MAITLADFTKIWASTSPLTPYTFSDPNYAEGWNFIGSTPPARQMWDSIQKQNDEKMKYIVDNFLPLSGGTITNDLEVNGALTQNGKSVEDVTSSGTNYIRYESGLQICWDSTSTITTATTVTLILPVAFVNNGYKVAIGRWWAAAAGEEYYVHDATTTDFKLTTIGSVGGGGHSYMYIAIGKWK